jgi:hypothetical protein
MELEQGQVADGCRNEGEVVLIGGSQVVKAWSEQQPQQREVS